MVLQTTYRTICSFLEPLLYSVGLLCSVHAGGGHCVKRVINKIPRRLAHFLPVFFSQLAHLLFWSITKAFLVKYTQSLGFKLLQIHWIWQKIKRSFEDSLVPLSTVSHIVLQERHEHIHTASVARIFRFSNRLGSDAKANIYIRPKISISLLPTSHPLDCNSRWSSAALRNPVLFDSFLAWTPLTLPHCLQSHMKL